MTTRRAKLFVVDDSKADQTIIARAITDASIKCELTVRENGAEALDYLNNLVCRDATLLPDLVLMDINMPVMDGKEALAKIRQAPQLKHLPVVMLTTSNRDKDVLESYQLGVNAYLTKPVEKHAFIDVIRQLENFWFDLVTLPKS